MPHIRPLNEFGREPVVMALEMARTCAAHCTYCFAALNSLRQIPGREIRHEDKSTFEKIANQVVTEYNSSNFVQYYIKNQYPVSMSNTVEPTQDPISFNNSLAILKALAVPLFLQFKGMNFEDCFDSIRDYAYNTCAYVSIPSLDERVPKRFEPGTPPISKRLSYLRRLRDAGCFTIAAISPYHNSFSNNPTGFAQTLIDHGAQEIFVDHLHLSRRQRPLVRDKVLLSMLQNEWDEETLFHMYSFYSTCIKNEILYFNNSYKSIVYQMYNSNPTIIPQNFMRDGRGWPYNDAYFLADCEYHTADSPNPSPIIITWEEALKTMHQYSDDPGIQTNTFLYRAMHDFIDVARLGPLQRSYLRRNPQPAHQYIRAIWNSPNKNCFAWRHPFVRYAAVEIDSEHIAPIHDDNGDIIMIYDPQFKASSVTAHRITSFEEMQSFDQYVHKSSKLVDAQQEDI